MFYSKPNTELISKAYDDFTRRLRWRISFAFQDKADFDELEQPYDPDFEVKRTSTSKPPKLPAYIEQGIEAGREFVNSYISQYRADKEEIPFDGLEPNPRVLREFLLSHGYIVTQTDKNLGIAVSDRKWVNEKCVEILSDLENYEEFHDDDPEICPPEQQPESMHDLDFEAPRDGWEGVRRAISSKPRNLWETREFKAAQYLNRQCDSMLSIADLAEEVYSKQLADFLRSQVTEKVKLDKLSKRLTYGAHSVPTFYGIPKIHKVPVKFRPIIPCHSSIINPAAKYVSKCLKPLIESIPEIIHGSKDLAIKLSKLELTPRSNYYLVTGDVVAFYPNIPLERCLEIVEELYFEFMGWTKGSGDEKTVKLQQLFTRCLRTGNSNLIFQYEDRIFRQIRGLAMGVASSPDLANLFGYYFERKVRAALQFHCPFYGRYIDDCLAIVRADTAAQALAKIRNFVVFDECEIVWNVSWSSQPFLDMLIYFDGDRKVHHMPYRKARNNQERIPWTSAHPASVKRGTFVGEMSRLATLSSTLTTYREALYGLTTLYLKRGYPAQLVKKWLKDETSRRWEQRLDIISRADQDLLLLKSEYNAAWDHFSANDLVERIRETWQDWLSKAESGKVIYHDLVKKDESMWGSLVGVDEDLLVQVHVKGGNPFPGELWTPDVRKLGFLYNGKALVSKKATLKLIDLTNSWKKIALQWMETTAVPRFPSGVDGRVRFLYLKKEGWTPYAPGNTPPGERRASDYFDSEGLNRRGGNQTTLDRYLSNLAVPSTVIQIDRPSSSIRLGTTYTSEMPVPTGRRSVTPRRFRIDSDSPSPEPRA